MYSRKVGNRTYTTPVPMAKQRIPDPTLKSILTLAGVTVEEFRQQLR